MNFPRNRAFRGLCAAALCLSLGACVIDSEGMHEVELALPEIFPPSKTVASYRQAAAPKQIKGDEFAVQLGGEERRKIVKNWGEVNTLYCDYGLPNKPPHVRVTISELPSKTSCYGAYTNLRPALLPPGQYTKIGVHATLDGSRLYCTHSSMLIVVRVLEKMTDEQMRTLLINFARAISRRIPRGVNDIDAVQFMPFQNRVPASERLDKDDPLGVGLFNQGGITALYRVEDREGKVFIAQLDEMFGKQAHIQKLKDMMEKQGKVKESYIGDVGWKGKLFDQRCFVSQRKQAVFGVFGTLSEEEMRDMMAEIDRRVKPYVPPNMKDVVEKEERKAQEPSESDR